MNLSISRIFLDVGDRDMESQTTLSAKQGDTTRRLIISLVEHRDAYMIAPRCYAVFTAKREDGTCIQDSCQVQDNTIICDLPPSATVVPGVVHCDITLYGYNGEVITSPRFTLQVFKTAVSDIADDLVSSDSFAVLNHLITEANEVINTEAERVLAEYGRVEAEGGRVLAEEARVEAEALRVEAENARAAAENARAAAESGRVSAEEERVVAEAERGQYIGDVDAAVDRLLALQEELLGGRVHGVARQEVIAAIKETMLIANDFQTNDPYKALSAAQGVILKSLIDGIADNSTSTYSELMGLIDGIAENYTIMDSGWYNGTGEEKYGTEKYPMSLVFPFVPRLIIIVENVGVRRIVGDLESSHEEYLCYKGLGFVFPHSKIYMKLGSDLKLYPDSYLGNEATVEIEGTTVKLTGETPVDVFNAISCYRDSDGVWQTSGITQDSGYGYTYFAFK